MNLYIKTGCPWCEEAIEWLQQREMKFRIIDVLRDAESYQHLRSISGQSRTPTLELVDNNVLADFDVHQLEKFLKDQHVI